MRSRSYFLIFVFFLSPSVLDFLGIGLTHVGDIRGSGSVRLRVCSKDIVVVPGACSTEPMFG